VNWEIGQALRELTKPPITAAQLKEYAAASGDGNPIHLDASFAREAGFPSVIVHGMISMAFMGDHLLANFPNERFRLGKIRARFRKVTFPGDTLSCEGKIKKVLPSGGYLVQLATRNQHGEVTTDGEAEVHPSA
jgi:acyl dehydratase